jgi:hypothetical protein
MKEKLHGYTYVVFGWEREVKVSKYSMGHDMKCHLCVRFKHESRYTKSTHLTQTMFVLTVFSADKRKSADDQFITSNCAMCRNRY